MNCRLPSDAKSFGTRGNEYYHTGHYSEALSEYSAAIKLLESTSTLLSHNLLSRLYHNRALTNEKLGDSELNDEKVDAQASQADARRATELDITYVKAWALFARLIEKAAHKDAKNVDEALDATHRVMELEDELCNGIALDALNTMEKLVRWKLERHLEMTPFSETMGEIDLASLSTSVSKLLAINDEVELNQHLVQYIRILFKTQISRNMISIFRKTVAVDKEQQWTVAEALIYYALGRTFSKMANFRMSISCMFQWIHLLNQLDQSPLVNLEKVRALYNLQSLYTLRQDQHFQHEGKWIEMALQLHNDPDSEWGIRLRIKAARVHINEMEYTRGLQQLKLCLEVCKQKGYREMGAMVRVQMGFVLNLLGNSEASLRFSKEALSVFEEMGDLENVAFVLKNIGMAQLNLDQFDEALGSLESALNFNSHPMVECEIKRMIGFVYLRKASDCNNYGDDALLQVSKKYLIESRNLAIKINSEWKVLNADTSLAEVYALLVEQPLTVSLKLT